MPDPVPAPSGPRRFRPRPWPTLAAVAVVATTIAAGNWQARRADFRAAQQEALERMQQQAPLVIRSAADVTPDQRFRTARLEGTYDEARQVWLDNRTLRGVAGYYVYTPLKLDDGTYVLVDRGWIAGTGRREAPPAPPPPGRVEVAGRLNLSPPSFIELKDIVPSGPVWENLSLEVYARTQRITVAPLLLEETAASGGGLVRERAAPDAGREKNVSYMWQWYSFAGLTIVLWLALNWRRDEPAQGDARSPAASPTAVQASAGASTAGSSPAASSSTDTTS